MVAFGFSNNSYYFLHSHFFPFIYYLFIRLVVIETAIFSSIINKLIEILNIFYIIFLYYLSFNIYIVSFRMKLYFLLIIIFE